MRRFELIDSEKDAPPCAVIECDQATSTFTATVEGWAGPQDVPVQFGFFVAKGRREIPPEWVWSWVEERIAPPSRQNIGSVMRANGLGEYDPLELLLAGEGRSLQDGFYLREVTEGFRGSARLGREIRLARDVACLTQAELSRKSGVPQETISRIERGRANPTMSTLEKLARAMGTKINLTIG